MTRLVPVVHGLTADRPDEDDVIDAARAISAALAARGYDSPIVTLDLDLTELERLAARRPHVVFNLVEAIRGDGRLGPIACAVLEHLRLPFTGAGSLAYTQNTSKLLMKALLRANGLPSPDWWTGAAPTEHAVIVKSVLEHASYGMDHGSIVAGGNAAREIAARERRFGGQFFCEAFIEGREFNVSVLETADGPRVLPIAEMCFDGLPPEIPTIVDYAAKWDPGCIAYNDMKRGFGLEEREPDLADRLRGLTLACCTAADLRGYARVDFRVDPQGRPFILEFNANPCLAPDAGFAAALAAAGISYECGIETIVEAAYRARRY